MRIRRAILFIPGDDRRKIEKGAGSGVDAVVLDCEDGVAANRKAEARATIAAALGEVDFGRSERIVRVNPFSTHLTHDDLAAVLPAKPDAILLPKVESASDIHLIDRMMAETEAALLALVETARGVVHLREIAAAAETIPRLQALIFGAEDFAGDIGAVRTASGHEIAYARGAVVVHAKAFGLQAIDMVFLPLDDEAGLRAEARSGRELGYTGKMAIHPRQIAPIHETFIPTAEEIAAAKRLIEAFEAHQAAGRGAFQLDGKMVDMPILRAAQNVIASAQAAGLLDG